MEEIMTMKISRLANPRLVWLLLGAGLVTGGISFYGISKFSVGNSSPEPTPTIAIAHKISALGRLEPESEVLKLAAPSLLDSDRIAQVLVKEGDTVRAGQVIAVLDAKDRLEDEVQQAQAQVKTAQAKLAQVMAGAKTGELQAQTARIDRLGAELAGSANSQAAVIARWQAEVQTARKEYTRFQQLYQEGAVAAANLDSKRLGLDTAEAQLREAIATQDRVTETLQAQQREASAALNQIAEVRPVDIQTAQAEVDSAISAVKRAETVLDRAFIRAPIAGQILKIHARVGEKPGTEGIVDLGRTDRMVAVAEVYQTDVGKVKIGQQAVITGAAIADELQGKVVYIDLQVSQQKVFSNKPGENLDRRVVEVKILLNPEDSQKVSALTNLQIQAVILPNP